MKKSRILIGLLLAAFFLYLFLRNIDLHEVWAVIRGGNPLWLLLAVGANLLNYFLRAVRWRYFLLPIKKTRLWNLYNTTVIGFALSSIFPARIGEVVRPYLLGSKEQISKTSALATIVVERVVDTLTILFILVVYLLVLIHPDQLSEQAKSSLVELKRAGLVLFAAVIGLALFLYYLTTKPTLVKKMAARVEKWLPAKMANKLDDILDSFIQGLSILHDPKLLLKIAAWSIFMWLVICFSFWAGVVAYIPDFHFSNVFLILVLLAIGVAVPTPGAVGSYHLACKIGLTRFFGVPDAQAGAIAVVSHFIGFVPVTLLGILFLWREGLTAGKISEIAESKNDPDSGPRSN